MRKNRQSNSSKIRSRKRKFEYLYSVVEYLDSSDFSEFPELSDYEEDVDREFSPYLSEYEEDVQRPVKTRSIWIPLLGTYTWTIPNRRVCIENDYDVDFE
jgi:hypothetical protein